MKLNSDIIEIAGNREEVMVIEKLKVDKIYINFMKFVIGGLIVIFLPLVNSSWNELMSYKSKFGITDVVFIIITMVMFLILFYLNKKNIKDRYVVLGIFFVALVLRLMYVITIKSIPISDFAIMYETAGSVLKGDFSALWGTGYIARFPHITIPVMYFALIRSIFGESLLAIKVINAIVSSLNIVIVYLIVKEIFESKVARVAALITAIFPPLILYAAIYTTENLAVPCFLLSIYFFILYVKDKNRIRNLVFSGILLSVANLFRMVGIIILIAYILYLIVSYDGKLKRKLLSTAVIILSFLVPLIGTSFTLHYSGVIEYQLWKGREPNITSILKGFNVEYKGRWNPEDAAIPETYNFDYDRISEVCKEKIFERITTTPKDVLLKFMIDKYTSQWCVGDFSGSYWAEHSIGEEDILLEYSENGIWFGQLFYVILISLSYVGLLNFGLLKNKRESSIFYYIFCGYGLFYLISENQSRYAFTSCWIFIILALIGIDFISNIKVREQ